MEVRTGFEPVKAMPADLQSAPFDRFGTLPKLAEREGFEPSVRSYTYDDLANRCFRPLSHLSGMGMVVGTGFEPVKAMPANLQSAPFDRFGILPNWCLIRSEAQNFSR